MDDVTRRDLLKAAGAAGACVTLFATPALASATQTEDHDWTEAEAIDRQRVLDCGFTEDEADCWELVARAGGKFFSLPKLHPTADAEVAQAIHVIQDKLPGRPAYRKYLDLAMNAKK
jgi:hypothetical protein